MKRKLKNIFITFMLVVAMVVGSNLPLASGLTNAFKYRAMAAYEATTERDYNFSNDGVWTTSRPSDSILINKFAKSAAKANLFEFDGTKPATNYKGDSLSLSGNQIPTSPDQFALTLQADNAPTKVRITKTNDSGQTVYEKDADDNYLLYPKLYDSNQNNSDLYVKFSDTRVYNPLTDTSNKDKFVKKLTDTSGAVKQDSAGKDLYEPEVYSSNEGNTNLYINNNDGTFNRKVVSTEEIDSYYGYRTTETTSFEKNSWYVVSVWLYTTSGTTVSVCVNPSSTKSEFAAKIEPVDTHGQWVLYNLFIETLSDSDTNAYVYIYYGSKDSLVYKTEGDETPTPEAVTGAVFADDMTIKKISQTDYKNRTINGETPEGEITQYSGRYDIDSLLDDLNPNFSEGDISIYPTMFGDEGYDGELMFDPETHEYIMNNAFKEYAYQYYIDKYTSDSSTTEKDEFELNVIRQAYKNRFTHEIVSEEEEFTHEEDKKDENGNVINGEDGNPEKEEVKGPNTFDPENTILKMANTSAFYDLGFLSKPFVVPQFSYYRLSLYIKGKEDTDQAIIKLYSAVVTGNSGDDGLRLYQSQTVNAYTTTSDFTNNWIEVSFYIRGNAYRDMPVQLAILASKNSTIYVDHIRLENIGSSSYTSSTSTKRLDLSASSTIISSNVTNGNFTEIETTNSDPEKNTAPYAPANWTKLSDNSEDVVAGIVSTKDKYFDEVSSKLGGAENPIQTVQIGENVINLPRTNVLAIYSPKDSEGNPVERTYGYSTNGDIYFSSNGVYRLTFQVFTCATGDSNFSGNIFARLKNGDDIVAEFDTHLDSGEGSAPKDEENPAAYPGWVTYTFLIRTGNYQRNFKLELGVKDAVGTAFFQMVNYKQLESKTDPDAAEDATDDEKTITPDEQYKELEAKYPTHEAQLQNKIRFLVYDGDNNIMHSLNTNDDGYYDSYAYELRESDSDTQSNQGVVGIVDSQTGFPLLPAFDKAYYDASTFANNDFVMFIHNGENLNTHVDPRTQVSLSASSYYQISVYVKTYGIPEGSGLTIRMNQVSATFENINTEHTDYGDLSATNGYKKFTAFVKTGTSTISSLRIAYELGTTKNSKGATVSTQTTGTAFIAGLEITKVANEDAYNELIADVDSNDTTTLIKDFTSVTENVVDNDADNLTVATFFLVFSSILLVGALIFAIVALYIKRVPRKNRAGAGDDSDNGGSNGAAPKDGFV